MIEARNNFEGYKKGRAPDSLNFADLTQRLESAVRVAHDIRNQTVGLGPEKIQEAEEHKRDFLKKLTDPKENFRILELTGVIARGSDADARSQNLALYRGAALALIELDERKELEKL